MQMRRSVLILCLFVSILVNGFAQDKPTTLTNKIITSFALKPIAVNKTKQPFFTHNKPTLFVFLSPECPLCQNYTLVLNGLQLQYSDSINVCGIFPGKSYTAKDITTFAKTYSITFALYIDKQKKLSNYLQATTTPQAILVSDSGAVLYSGAIDNWAVSLAKRRPAPTEFYLKNAIAQTLLNTPIMVKTTNPVGCKINDF